MDKIRYILAEANKDNIVDEKYSKEELNKLEQGAQRMNLDTVSYAKVKKRLDLIEEEKAKFTSTHIPSNMIDIYEFAIHNKEYIKGKKSYLIINPNGEHFNFSPYR